MATTKTIISAVHDDDLIEFLKSLGVLSHVTNGEAQCKFCRQVITIENLAAVFPEGGDIKFVCDKPGCLALLAQHRSELRGREQTGSSNESNPQGEVAHKGHGAAV